MRVASLEWAVAKRGRQAAHGALQEQRQNGKLQGQCEHEMLLLFTGSA